MKVRKGNRKKSLTGWVRKDWVMKMCRGNAKIPTVFPDNKVYYDMSYVPSVKVCVTIEELKEMGLEKGE